MGSYFKSIMGLLNHNLVSTLVYLNRYRHSFSFPSLEHPAMDFTNPGFGKPLHHDLAELQKHQQDADRVFIALTGELTDEVLEREIVYTDLKGNEIRRPLWQALLQLFNHQTHHRGQVSQILDSLKIDHDFSGIAAVF